MRHRSELVRRTARATGYNQRYVLRVVREFITQMSVLLGESGVVVLDDFGRFAVEVGKRRLFPVTREVEAERYVRVHFSKSRALRELLNEEYLEEDMDKYGVDQQTGKDQEDLEKQASKGCPEPDCGKELTKHGSVLICPVHGSAPFESKNER